MLNSVVAKRHQKLVLLITITYYCYIFTYIMLLITISATIVDCPFWCPSYYAKMLNSTEGVRLVWDKACFRALGILCVQLRDGNTFDNSSMFSKYRKRPLDVLKIHIHGLIMIQWKLVLLCLVICNVHIAFDCQKLMQPSLMKPVLVRCHTHSEMASKS